MGLDELYLDVDTAFLCFQVSAFLRKLTSKLTLKFVWTKDKLLQNLNRRVRSERWCKFSKVPRYSWKRNSVSIGSI